MRARESAYKEAVVKRGRSRRARTMSKDSDSRFGQIHEAAERVDPPHLLDRRARDSSSRGLATTIARHIARDTATLRRLREKRNWSERGTSSALDVAIE